MIKASGSDFLIDDKRHSGCSCIYACANLNNVQCVNKR